VYGMVNQALEDMLIERFGRPAWENVKKEAGVNVEVFITSNAYPDQMTYSLVGAASRTLGMTTEEVLRGFGQYWILKTARDGYGELLNLGGSNLPEFLENLPTFHTRISLIFSHLQPPGFSCQDITATSLRLRYYSDRPGLSQFVVGLLEGLGDMFKTPVRVLQEGSAGPDRDYDLFLVEWEQPQP